MADKFILGFPISDKTADSVLYQDGSNVGIGTTSPTSDLTIGRNGNASGGNIMLGRTTNTTNKYSAITSQSYNSSTDTEGFAIIATQGINGTNLVSVGGGINEVDSATQLRFYTSSATGTRTGSERMRITSAGAIEIKGQGTANTFIGDSNAGNLGTRTGTNNTGFGYNALSALTTGSLNVAVGTFALDSLTTANYNTAVGYNTAASITTGSENTAIGYNTLYHNSTGTRNTAIGHLSMHGAAGNSANYNTAVGWKTMRLITTGSHNAVLGMSALENITSGDTNVAVGNYTGQNLTTQSNNVIIGYYAMQNAQGSNAHSNVAIGVRAGENLQTNANVAIGYEALHDATTASSSTAIGYQAMENLTTGDQNTAIGYGAILGATTATRNTATGYQSMLSTTTGNYNCGYGYGSLVNATTGARNVAIGYTAGGFTTSGVRNVFLGMYSGQHESDGTTGINPSDSVYIGYDTRSGVTDGTPVNENVIGYAAVGNGDNTLTLGNAAITALHCQVQSITALSDARDKKDIKPITEGIDFINKLNPVTFEWDTRDGAKKDIKDSGFIAQELLEAQNSSDIAEHLDLVDTKNEDMLQARYGNLIPVLVKALQEQQAQIEELKSKIKQI